jgi:hypothetical protein
MIVPSEHVLVAPAAHESNEQPPLLPAGHWREHFAPASHVAWHGGERQTKLQLLFAPHVQVPSAQVPSHCPFCPAQMTLHGAAWHVKLQLLPTPHVQFPSSQTPLQAGFCPSQSTWQGPELQANVHIAPNSQWQSPSAHAAAHVEPPAQATAHGGESQLKSQSKPLLQVHALFEQSKCATELPLHEGKSAKTIAVIARSQSVANFMGTHHVPPPVGLDKAGPRRTSAG